MDPVLAFNGQVFGMCLRNRIRRYLTRAKMMYVKIEVIPGFGRIGLFRLGQQVCGMQAERGEHRNGKNEFHNK